MSFSVLSMRGFVSTLNQPEVKQGVKNVLGTITFLGGMLPIGCFVFPKLEMKMKGLKVIKIESPKKLQKVVKPLITEGMILKFSLVLSAISTPIGNAVTGKIMKKIFTEGQLVKWFGPNTIFAINPAHPRHFISIIAVISALPSLLKMIRHSRNYRVRLGCFVTLDYSILRKIALFNLITSRPILHIGNSLAGRLVKQ